MSGNKKSYLVKMNISYNKKEYSAGQQIEVEPEVAVGLIQAGAIEKDSGLEFGNLFVPGKKEVENMNSRITLLEKQLAESNEQIIEASKTISVLSGELDATNQLNQNLQLKLSALSAVETEKKPKQTAKSDK